MFRWVTAIISQPAEAWALLAKKGEKQEEFLFRLVYPLVGFVAVAAFLSVLFMRKESGLELTLKSSIRTSVSSFGGLYLGTCLINGIWQGMFKREKDLKLWLRFVGYSSSSMFILNIVLILLPKFFSLWIFTLHTFYTVQEGAGPYIGVKGETRLKFIGFTTAIILLAPVIIEILLLMLISGSSFW